MNELDILLALAPSPNPGLMISFEYQGMPPLGIGYLGTYLSKFNYSVKLIDMSFRDVTINTFMKTVESKRPKMIGLSCTTETYLSAVQIASIVKSKYPDIIIVFGGPHVSFEYEAALSTGVVDFVICNEGEISLKELCDYCIRKERRLEDLKGIVYKKDGKTICAPSQPLICDLDEIPFPDRKLFDKLESYAHPATCSTSRGCPGKCIFCAASALSGGKYRLRSAKNVVQEFAYLKSLGFNHVEIIDDTMTASVKRLNEFLDELISQDLGMTWYCESRVDVMTKELLTKMKKAGLNNIQFGVEAGSQKMLDSLKKNITMEQIRNVFNWCNELRIMSSTNMIIGQPYDTPETINDTLNIAEEVASLGASVNFTVCTPFPGTALWEHKEDYNIKILDNDLNHYSTFCAVYDSKYMKAKEIQNAYYKSTVDLHRRHPKNINPSLQRYIRRIDAFNFI
ncbi:B12-binding domain-containing radical SAM protein [Clostridium hydrogenum]|uniref:B12-binding domain-containing radical SAM protein n=1 Tax=Clostridium hydrogenum TaxID=2855764 RepID=UPI001F1E7172|nr:radical SAM protein [Clostridium hydrogenum]